MHVHIIWIGKTKDRLYEDICKTYQKHIASFASLEITEIPSELKSFDNRKQIQEQEQEKIFKILRSDYHYFYLDESGKEYDSIEFSQHIFSTIQQTGKLGFIIGGVYGFSDQIKQRQECISFSRMTFTHQMIRIILLEQIYRACTIEYNKQYHY